MKDIFAVIWLDFIPLSLRCDNAAEAIQKAKAIHAKSTLNKSGLREIRAVHLPAESDKLINLWSA